MLFLRLLYGVFYSMKFSCLKKSFIFIIDDAIFIIGIVILWTNFGKGQSLYV